MTAADRLAALEDRVAVLEAAAAPGPAEGPDGSGEVTYQGNVRLSGEITWTIVSSPSTALALPGAPVAEVLAALGHPVRLALVRRLVQGPATAAELQEAGGLSSSGQVYHHLRSLTAARVAEQDGRSYRVPATAVVPLLVMVLAAGDVAGALR